MKRLYIAVAALGFVAGFSGCRVSVDAIPSGVMYACTGAAADECPEGWSCDTSATLDGGGHLCVAPNSKSGLPGASCSGASDCQNGLFCVDGLCCNAQCDGLCMACNVEGSKGTCAPVPALTDPANECATVHDSICAPTCNGAGACSAPAPGSTCGNCRACSAEGLCGADCGNYACDPDGGACKSACVTGADCASDADCVEGTCQTLLRNGSTCTSDGNCGSGHCIAGSDGGPGVCCAEDCRTDNGPCGYIGACDLTDGGANFGHCQFQPAQTQCSQGSCSSGSFIAPQYCAGDGAPCPTPTPQPCPNGLGCANPIGCSGACLAGTQQGCDASSWCRVFDDGGLGCVASSQQDGDPCNAASDCVSSHCDHSLCCSGGTCCGPVDGGSATANCPAVNPVCDQPDQCLGHETDWACQNSVCTASTATNLAVCSGTVSPCGNFRDSACAASGSTCPTTCAPAGTPDDSYCDLTDYCQFNTQTSTYLCVAKILDGAPCDPLRGDSCQSDSCGTNGHCCPAGSDGGQCCNVDSDCVATPTCTSPTNCQGSRPQYTCEAHVCVVTATVADDSACNYAANPSHWHPCPNNFAFYCDGSAAQTPVCPTTCSGPPSSGVCPNTSFCTLRRSTCAPGHACVAGPCPNCIGSCQ